MVAASRSRSLPQKCLPVAGVGLLAGVLHVALSWPAILHIRDSVPGGMSDGVNAFGHVWLVYYNGLLGNGDIGFTRMAFYPAGIVFGVRPLLFWYALLGWAGHFVYDNLVFWHNLGLAGSSVFTAMGVYVLAFRLTRHRGAAILAAVLFTFSPRRMEILQGHINYYSTGFLAWATVAFSLGLRRNAGLWAWIGGGALWAMQAWQAPDMMIFLGFIWGPLTLWWWWEAWVRHVRGDQFSPRKGPRYAPLWAPLVSPLMAMLSFIPTLITAYTYRHLRLSSEQYPWPRTHWFEFIHPSPLHHLYRPWGRLVEEAFFVPGHNEAFLGFAGLLGIALFLAVGGIRLRRFRPWLLLSAFLLVLTLGTAASFFGAFDLPLPYRVMMHVPVLKELRIPARFNTLFSLGTALMAAMGWAIYYRRRLPGAKALLGFLLVLGILDGCYAPIETTKLRDDPRYYPMGLLSQIRQDPDRDISVLVVPIDIPATISQAQQTIHEHPTYDGFDPRMREEHFEQLTFGPMGSLWTLDTKTTAEDVAAKIQKENLSVQAFHGKIGELGLRYVLLRRGGNPRAAFHEAVVRRYFPIEREQAEGDWVMFVLRKKGMTAKPSAHSGRASSVSSRRSFDSGKTETDAAAGWAWRRRPS